MVCYAIASLPLAHRHPLHRLIVRDVPQLEAIGHVLQAYLADPSMILYALDITDVPCQCKRALWG
jgi:hypothetical protein